MSGRIHYLKEFLETCLAKVPAGSMTTASLLRFWLDLPAPNALADMLPECDTVQLRDGLDAIIESALPDGNRWILRYIAEVPDLGSLNLSAFLRDCIAEAGGALAELLAECGISADSVPQPREPEQRNPALIRIQQDAAHAPKYLIRYGRDLLECARRDEFAGLIRRRVPFEQLQNVLRKSRKGNAIITGPAGAGKTALVEFLANARVRNELGGLLGQAKLFEIHLSKLLAGTQYRGMFEERLEQVIAEAVDRRPVILFIDEIHLLWGAGRTSESAMDASNILKPHLARSDLRVIGATTSGEYRNYILRDPALARRFEEIRLTAPDTDLTLRMVERQRRKLEEAHQVSFETGCVPEAVALTDRRLPNRQQPDKAIDLLDTIAAKISARGGIRVRQKDIRAAFAREGRQSGRLEDVASEAGMLSERLNQGVLGQTAAVGTVARALAMRRVLDRPSSSAPLSFLFAGGSGVGKSSLAKHIAKVFFGSERQCLHLDLGGYNTPFHVSKILGAPGLSGAGGEGLLPAFLDAHPEGVLLFDEIEKAHPDIMDMALGLLDHGTVTTAGGYGLNASGCVFIATTNALQSDELQPNPIGFHQTPVKTAPLDALAGHFRAEFLNRFNEILVFENLDKDTLAQIVRNDLAAYGQIANKADKEVLVQTILRQMGSRRDARAAKRATRRAVETLLITPPHSAAASDVGQ